MGQKMSLRVVSCAALCAGLLAAPVAGAHVESTSAQSALAAWPWDVAVALLFAALVYARGISRMRDKREAGLHGRHWAFYVGLAAVFAALLTPLDAISEHVFAVHQIQHLLLRGIAPMLLMLAVPSGPMIAGLPVRLRQRIVAPLMTQRAVRAIFGLLARPLVCTLLYVGALYVWQVPAIHELALLHSGWHYLMHVTMLLSGLLFFWVVFDPRPQPWATPFPVRLVMLGAATFANIPLGAVITLKDTVVYVAYDQLGRWWGVSALSDELMGGLVIWMLASMMGLVAVLLLVRLWGRSEERLDQRRRQGFALPGNGRSGARSASASAASARRRVGWALALIPVVVLAGVVTLAVWLTWHPGKPPLPVAPLVRTGAVMPAAEAAR